MNSAASMIWLKRVLFSKYLLIRTIILIFTYNVFNNHVISLIYGTMKYSFYKIIEQKSVYESCIINNPFFKPEEFTDDRCVSCESINEIDRIHDTFYDEIEIVYVRRNKPVIVTDAMYDWKIDTDTVDTKNLTQVYLQQLWFHNYAPCNISTNFDSRIEYLFDYFSLIMHPLTENWFINWKNCEISAAKMARYFYKQPYFLKYFLPAAQVNWIIMSSRYQTNNYREMFLATNKLIVIMQLRGSFKISVTPRKNCDRICPRLNETIHEYEMMVLNSNLWHLQFSPQTEKFSLTIITENELK